MPVHISSKYCLLICFFAIIFFSSCSDDPKNKIIFQALDESLVRASRDMMRSSETIDLSFQERLLDPATSVIYGRVYPKVQMIQNLTTEMKKYIEDLKANLQNGKTLDKDKANDLYSRLVKYKTDLLKIDPKITAAFDSVLIITTKSFDSNEKKDFAKTFFSHISTEGAMSLLSMFYYNVVNIENRMVLFCHNQPSGPHHEEWFWPLIAQSSTYVQAGEKIEITAGIGYLSNRFDPEIIISGIKIPLNESRLAVHKFSASRKPGKHFVPVEITYMDQDGGQQTISKTIEYTVAKGLDR